MILKINFQIAFQILQILKIHSLPVLLPTRVLTVNGCPSKSLPKFFEFICIAISEMRKRPNTPNFQILEIIFAKHCKSNEFEDKFTNCFPNSPNSPNSFLTSTLAHACSYGKWLPLQIPFQILQIHLHCSFRNEKKAKPPKFPNSPNYFCETL